MSVPPRDHALRDLDGRGIAPHDLHRHDLAVNDLAREQGEHGGLQIRRRPRRAS
jgi:hypothetical protein